MVEIFIFLEEPLSDLKGPTQNERPTHFEDLKWATCTLRDLNRIDRVFPRANNRGPLGPGGPSGA